ncbi:hypothetical protein [Piscinibacter terrae]|nr:hypothetical protein [Albitalea terrae]
MALDDIPETDDPYELISRAAALEFGAPERSSLLDRAIVLADRSGSQRAQFDARMARVEDATFGGDPEIALAHFAWCKKLAAQDAEYMTFEMRWYHKYVSMGMASFARISQRQIDAIDADMMALYKEEGISLRPVYTCRVHRLQQQGRVAEARQAWDEAMTHRRDAYADCAACEKSRLITLLLSEERYDEVVRVAEPIVAGQLKCAEVPHTVLPRVMQALNRLGDAQQAEALADRSYRLIRSNPNFLSSTCTHVHHRVALGQFDKAASLLLRHAPWALACRDDLDRLEYANTLGLVLRLGRDQRKTRSASLPKLADVVDQFLGAAQPGASPADYDLLLQRVDRAGQAMSAALDARNGNSFFARAWGVCKFQSNALT